MANYGPYYNPGSYVGEIVDQGLSKAKTGTNQFVLRFKVLGAPMDDSYVPEPQQYERTMYMAITEKTITYFKENLEKLGFTGTSFGQLDLQNPNAHSFVGQQIDLYCQHKPGQDGQMKESWMISRGGSGGLKLEPLNSKDVRELDSLFGRELSKKSPTTKAAPAARSANTEASLEIDDSDLPF